MTAETNRRRNGAITPPVWSLLSRLLWLALLVWIAAGWAAVAGHWSVGYPVDAAATMLMALPLAAAAMVSAWQGQRLALLQAQATHKQWLSVLLVKRDQAERAAETLETLCESLDLLARRCRQPTAQDAPVPLPTERAHAPLNEALIVPLVEQEQALRPLLQAVRARLINLHVRMGRGDPVEGLGFEVQSLADEFQQVEHRFNTVFGHVNRMQQQLDDLAHTESLPDPYGELRPWLQSALDDLAQARRLLAETLGQPLTPSPSGLDDALGLSNDHA